MTKEGYTDIVYLMVVVLGCCIIGDRVKMSYLHKNFSTPEHRAN